ncbi:hypothetical protein Ct61P_15119 [Colletotrichum tofieldiae]|nr:hypothetical protein Ct61P_15119 [Colletotrichum tofieldiae]
MVFTTNATPITDLVTKTTFSHLIDMEKHVDSLAWVQSASSADGNVVAYFVNQAFQAWQPLGGDSKQFAAQRPEWDEFWRQMAAEVRVMSCQSRTWQDSVCKEKQAVFRRASLLLVKIESSPAAGARPDPRRIALMLRPEDWAVALSAWMERSWGIS